MQILCNLGRPVTLFRWTRHANPSPLHCAEYKKHLQRPKGASRHVVAASEGAEGVEGVISGEWGANWSLASYDDVLTYFSRNMINKAHSPTARLSDIMQTHLITCKPEDRLDDLKASNAFGEISGMPVVRDDGVLVGVLAKSDLNKPGSFVHEVMSHPPVAARPIDTISDAACLMLKYKVDRIPIVDNAKRCVGIVTRTDVFTAMTMDSPGSEHAEMMNMDM